MSEKWNLPMSIELSGVEYAIRTDYRAILDIFKAIADEELTEQEKAEIMLRILYIDWQDISRNDLQEALQKGKEFIDCGIDYGTSEKAKKGPVLMDWERDSPIIAPAVNKVLGKDIRSMKQVHWWTFMAAYLEINDCLFNHVVAIRQKKAKKKKLEKWEEEFYRNNKAMVDLKQQPSRPKAEQDALMELLGLQKR